MNRIIPNVRPLVPALLLALFVAFLVPTFHHHEDGKHHFDCPLFGLVLNAGSIELAAVPAVAMPLHETLAPIPSNEALPAAAAAEIRAARAPPASA